MTFIYKCRLCGEREEMCNPSIKGGDELAALIYAYTEARERAFGMFTLHPCGQGKTGIADLIGVEPDQNV